MKRKNNNGMSTMYARFDQLHPLCKKCPNQGECPLKERSNKTSSSTLCFSGNRVISVSNTALRQDGSPVIIPEKPNEWKSRLRETMIEIDESPINASWFRFSYRPLQDEKEMAKENYNHFVNPQ